MSTASWVAYVALGAMCMWLMRYTASPVIDGILVRIAAVLFIGAGLVGADGWVGGALAWVVDAITGVAESMGSALVGASLVWVVALFLGVMWLMAMIPGKQSKFDAPDWLIVGGLVLPALLASVPGPAGEGLRTVMSAGGQLATGIVSGLVT